MSAAVVALLLGLALLFLAAGLFRRAAKHPSSRRQRPAPDTGSEGDTGTAVDTSADTPTDSATGGESAVEDEQWGSRAAADVRGSGDVPASSDTRQPERTEQPTPEPAAPETETPADVSHATHPDASSGGLFAGRRSRRQWAQSHGYEYAREDRHLAGEWPESLTGPICPEGHPVARDLVSGFTGGHQFHLAEVSGVTVVALRRDVFSPVQVHLSDGAAMPAGMRHSELCDRPPFTGYSTDNRALDRMLDSRMDAALHALGSSVSDIAYSGTWVVLKMARRTDPPIWDHVIVQGRTLVAASRVLPPRVTSKELDLVNADPTRPRVRRAAGHTDEPAGGEDAPANRGHLRAVPDAQKGAASPASEGTADTADTAADDRQDRPRMERSSTPVEFPSRSEGQSMGESADTPDTGWLGDPGDDTDAAPIPAVGQDPGHSRAATGSGPRVIRGAGESSTIFDDTTEDGDAEATEVAQADVPASPRGRHRAPSARHARRSDGDSDYPVVDAEVVNPEDDRTP